MVAQSTAITPTQFVSEVLTRLANSESLGQNGYGNHRYEIAAPSQDLALSTVRLLNSALRYQLCEEALVAREQEVEQGREFCHALRPREVPPDDLLVSGFRQAHPGPGIVLLTRGDKTQLIEWIREALLNPERGEDLRAEDGWRGVTIAGHDRSLRSIPLIIADRAREGTTGEDLNTFVRDVHAAGDALAVTMARMIPEAHRAQLCSITEQLPATPDLAAWIPSESAREFAQIWDASLINSY